MTATQTIKRAKAIAIEAALERCHYRQYQLNMMLNDENCNVAVICEEIDNQEKEIERLRKEYYATAWEGCD